MPRESHLYRVSVEYSGLGLLQPDECRQCGLIDIRSSRQKSGRDDVEIAVTVEIGGLRAVHARHRREGSRRERIGPRVFEPLNAVVWLHDPIVERIAVGQQHVEIAILVEVDEVEP